jgi:hypothetical protein
VTTSRTRAMVLLIVMFAVGLAAGIGGTAIAVRSGKAMWIWHTSRPPAREAYGAMLDRRLKLNLDPVVRDSINAVSRRGTQELGQIWQDTTYRPLRAKTDSILMPLRAAVDSIRKQTQLKVRSLLSPAQRERFDSMIRTDSIARRQGFGGRGNGGGPRGGPGDPGQRGGSRGSGQPAGGVDRDLF